MILSGGHEMSEGKKRPSSRGGQAAGAMHGQLRGDCGKFPSYQYSHNAEVLKWFQDTSTAKFSDAAKFFNPAAMLDYQLVA